MNPPRYVRWRGFDSIYSCCCEQLQHARSYLFQVTSDPDPDPRGWTEVFCPVCQKPGLRLSTEHCEAVDPHTTLTYLLPKESS